MKTFRDWKSVRKLNPPSPGALFLILLVILICRRPGVITHPQLWAEDGAVFFRDQLVMGGRAIWEPYAGYEQLLGRLAAAFAALLPEAWTPHIYDWGALSIDAICCGWLARPRYRPLLESDWLRAALCLLFAAAFPSFELVGNITNLQWFVLVASAPLFLVPPEPKLLSGRVSLFFIGTAIAFSCAAAVILTPLLLIRILKTRVGWPLQFGLLAGLAVQCAVMLRQSHGGGSGGFPHLLAQTALATAAALANQVILSSLLSQKHAFSLVTKAFPYSGLLVLSAFIAWIAGIWRRLAPGRRIAVLTAAYLAISSLVLAIAVRQPLRSSLLGFGQFIRFGGDRYFFMACCSFAFVAAIAIECVTRSWSGPGRAVLLLSVFGLGLIFNFRVGALGDRHFERYASQIESWRKAERAGKPHAPVAIPIDPDPWRIDLPGR